MRVVSKLERGEGNPRWSTLMAILGGLDSGLDDLAEKIDQKT